MASDAFLEIDGIKGESSDSKYKDQIEVLSYNWGVNQSASAVVSSSGGGTVARADFQDLTITKEVDIASPLIYKACWGGTHIKKVTLRLNRAAGDDRVKYMEYKLENVIISSVSIGGGTGGLPTESVTFNYAQITTTYTRQARAGGGQAGEVPAGFSLQENRHI